MHFRLATELDRGLVESLWDYCFEHREDPFFQWYFNHFISLKTSSWALKAMIWPA